MILKVGSFDSSSSNKELVCKINNKRIKIVAIKI